MDGGDQSTLNNIQFISQSYASKDEFIKDYENLLGGKQKEEALLVLVLNEMEEAIEKSKHDRVDSLMKLTKFIEEYEKDRGTMSKQLLHYAAKFSSLSVTTKYLIEHDVDVNAKDINGLTPLHVAAEYAPHSIEVVKFLLRHGAHVNSVDSNDRKPSDMTIDKDVVNMLASTEKLFESVMAANCAEVENCIKMSACVEAKDLHGRSSLHYAAKSNVNIVDILVKNGVDPNCTDSNGATPLHYAAEVGNTDTVRTLLIHGAIFNAPNKMDKLPVHLTNNVEIRKLFRTIDKCFEKVRRNDEQVITDLKNIKDVGVLKAVLRAKNRDNNTLIVTAAIGKYPKVHEFYRAIDMGVCAIIDKAIDCMTQCQYQWGLDHFRVALAKRKDFLGPDDPGTLEIERFIGQSLHKLGRYPEALRSLRETFERQKLVLGLDDEDTLTTRSSMALVMNRMGKGEEAVEIYREVHEKQSRLLGPNHDDTLTTLFHMAVALDGLSKHAEALKVYKQVYSQRMKSLGPDNVDTIVAQNNIGILLSRQGKREEGLFILEDVLERKKRVLGIHHVETARTRFNIAKIYLKQNKHVEAMAAFEEVLKIQKNILPLNHVETINTKTRMAGEYFKLGEWSRSLKLYQEILEAKKAELPSSFADVKILKEQVKLITFLMRVGGAKISDVMKTSQDTFIAAIVSGNVQAVESCLKANADVQEKDKEGRTPLHYAISHGHTKIVKILLEKGADVTTCTNKGNTALHTATLKGNAEVAMMLFEYIDMTRWEEFANAQTHSGGTAALHVAAKSGLFAIAKILLYHGANYRVVDNEDKKPVEVTKDENIKRLLTLVDGIFYALKCGDEKMAVRLLRDVRPDEAFSVANACDDCGSNLLEIARAIKSDKMERALSKMLPGKTREVGYFRNY